MDSLLNGSDIWGGYGKEMVIKGISINLEKGDFLGIIGPNGSGKSTFLRLLTRVITPRRGTIRLNGKDTGVMNSKEFSRQVAFVEQDRLIDFDFTVWEIVLMGRIPHLKRLQLETRKDFAIAENALSLTDALYLRDKGMDSLSAGERQRIIIAKALAQEPALLFLDEPTSHLDIGHQIMVLDLLKRLNKYNGLTVVIVLHDLNLASEYCDRLILLDKGVIFKEGTAEEVLTYQNIEKVYNTVVVVNKNPISAKPYMTLISGSQVCRQKSSL